MLVKRIAACTHLFFNRFPVIQDPKVAILAHFCAHFGLPWVRRWDYRCKCHNDLKRIQCLSNASQHVPTYLQPFLRYSEISVASDLFLTVFVSDWAFFLPHFAFHGYAPGTIAVSFTWIEREFNAGQTPRSIYPSIFNHFWDVARYRWRVTGFWQFSWANERFLPHFAFPWVRPWDNRGKYHTVGKRIQCLSNASQHVPIYLQPFLRYI